MNVVDGDCKCLQKAQLKQGKREMAGCRSVKMAVLRRGHRGLQRERSHRGRGKRKNPSEHRERMRNSVTLLIW